jgi:hypothetical protein
VGPDRTSCGRVLNDSSRFLVVVVVETRRLNNSPRRPDDDERRSLDASRRDSSCENETRARRVDVWTSHRGDELSIGRVEEEMRRRVAECSSGRGMGMVVLTRRVVVKQMRRLVVVQTRWEVGPSGLLGRRDEPFGLTRRVLRLIWLSRPSRRVDETRVVGRAQVDESRPFRQIYLQQKLVYLCRHVDTHFYAGPGLVPGLCSSTSRSSSRR